MAARDASVDAASPRRTRRHRMKRRTLLHASAALVVPALARAQAAYPTKPIRYIVPVAAGGGNDMIARVVTERWGRVLGQNFVVDNQSGGGGVIASVATARAAPDGYTLMQGYVATHGTTPATRRVPLRRDQGLHADRHDRRDAERPRRQQRPAGEDARRVHRLREAKPGQGQLRLGRAGLAHPPDDGALQAADRRLHAAHPVPRHRAGLHRPARRPDAGDVPRPRRGAAASALGPRPRPRPDRDARAAAS